MKSLVIINPKSGDYSINRFVTDFTTKKPDWLTIDILLLESEFIEKLIKSKINDYDSIIIAGGDGTISKIASIMSYCQNPPPFVPIPIGTGNDFSRFSGWFNIWDRGKFELFFHCLRDAKSKPVDIWDFNGNRFICYVSIGWDADVVGLYTEIKQKLKKWSLKRKFNTFLYIYCALLKLTVFFNFKKKNSLIFLGSNETSDKKIFFSDKETIILSNIRSYGGGAELPDGVDEKDKQIDVFHIKNPFEYIYFMISGRFDFLKKIKIFTQSNVIEINSETSYNLQIDGEWEGAKKEKIFFFRHVGQINYLTPFCNF